MGNYRFWVGTALIVLVLSESIYLLWRESYFMPELEKQTKALEDRVASLETSVKNTDSFKTVSANELIAQSQAVGSSVEEGKVAGTSNVEKKSSVVKESKININSAGAAELDKLPGIGPAYASRIIRYREQNGPFKNIVDIKKIKGIGESIFNKIKDLITI